jgi:hypothetical protein
MIRKLVFAFLITLSIAGALNTAVASPPYPECYPCTDPPVR